MSYLQQYGTASGPTASGVLPCRRVRHERTSRIIVWADSNRRWSSPLMHSVLRGITMTEMPEDLPVALPNDVPRPADSEIESKIDEAIASLWSTHQAFKGSAKQT